MAEAWRFEGEMHGVADAFAAEGVPDGFYLAAAEVYRRIAPLRGPDAPDRPAEIANVLHEARTSVTPRTKQASYGRFKP